MKRRERVGLAALDQDEVAVAVVGGEDGFEVQRLAFMLLPNLCGHDDEAGGRVAGAAVERGRVSIEVEQERRDFFLESVKIERVGGRDDARDLFGRRAKRIVRTRADFRARYVDEVEYDEPGA